MLASNPWVLKHILIFSLSFPLIIVVGGSEVLHECSLPLSGLLSLSAVMTLGLIGAPVSWCQPVRRCLADLRADSRKPRLPMPTMINDSRFSDARPPQAGIRVEQAEFLRLSTP